MQNTNFIDYSFQEGLEIKSVIKSIQEVRGQILSKRKKALSYPKKLQKANTNKNSEVFNELFQPVTYYIRVNSGILFYPSNPKSLKTSADNIYKITINSGTLYPQGWENGRPYTICYRQYEGGLLQGNAWQKAQLTAGNYNFNYSIGQVSFSDILGVLVAEQLRFNTFEVEADLDGLAQCGSAEEVFQYLGRKYGKEYYQDWKKLSSATEQGGLPNNQQVRVIIPHLDLDKY